jgi:hypothetical protein
VQKIDAVRHKDKRRNIPTEELRDFAADQQQAPREVKYPGLLYARDPSLDPQLVWKGNVEQDSRPIEVPAVPVYIQENVHPRRSSRITAARPGRQGEPTLAGTGGCTCQCAYREQQGRWHASGMGPSRDHATSSLHSGVIQRCGTRPRQRPSVVRERVWSKPRRCRGLHCQKGSGSSALAGPGAP